MTDTKPVITIIGCGYVGLTLAAVLSGAGYTVYAIEIDQKRLGAIKEGRSFFFEAGADPLIAAGVKSGKLIPTDSYEQAIPVSTIVFSSVGTPDNPDGSSNLSYVFDAASKAAALMQDGAIFVQKSTVPVGTGAKLSALFAASGKTIPYVSCPEFSREGTAIGDTLWFDRVITGSEDAAAAQKVLNVHRTIQQAQADIVKTTTLTPPATLPDSQYIIVSLNSAELIKVTANAFLALKISFANSVAKLADQAGADVVAVMDGIGSDKRIGRAFLNAGRGYGGGCFPKDVSGLIRTAEEYGTDMEIMRAASEVNDSMAHYIIRKAKTALGGTAADNILHDKTVAVLGLAFKAGTSDVRRSPAIVIANTLTEQGAKVKAYDPEAMEEARPHLDTSVSLADSMANAVADAECIFIATDWPEFTSVDMAMLAQASGAKILVDCMNCLDSATVKAAGLAYIGVGRP